MSLSSVWTVVMRLSTSSAGKCCTTSSFGTFDPLPPLANAGPFFIGTSCGFFDALRCAAVTLDGVFGRLGELSGVNGAKYGLAPICARRS